MTPACPGLRSFFALALSLALVFTPFSPAFTQIASEAELNEAIDAQESPLKFGAGVITFSGEKIITYSTSLLGHVNGGSILDGGNTVRLFYVDGDYLSNITGLIVQNGAAPGSNAGGRGGAIYVYDNLSGNIAGSTFSKNSASGTGNYSGQGGAIYANGDLTLSADSASAWFKGNQAGATPNAIYLANSGGNKTASLSAGSGHTMYFYDPIQSTTAPGLTIKINPDGASTGTVRFDGNYTRLRPH